MFIRLTNSLSPHKGDVLYLETESIISIFPEEDGAGILTKAVVTYHVQQTPEEVLAKIHPAYRQRSDEKE